MVMGNLLVDGEQRAQQAWPGSVLCAASAHGLYPDGSISPEGLWCLLFRTSDAVLALMWSQGRWTQLNQSPVVPDAVPTQPMVTSEIATSRVLAERLSGLAGFGAWQGRPEDALWLGFRDGVCVAVLSSAGSATLTVDARDPSTVLSMDFEPVRWTGEPV
jgi:hypothetical protein